MPPTQAETVSTIEAEPYELEFDPKTTALLIIDMQRDFVMPGGFGETLGNDVSLLQAAVEPTERVLDAAREIGMLVIHTREGHRPDLTRLPAGQAGPRRRRRASATPGRWAASWSAANTGHDIVRQLYPHRRRAGDRQARQRRVLRHRSRTQILHDRGIKTLIVCGVTTEVCVHTTVREANDRGYECVVLADCVASYFPEFQRVALR